MKAKHTSVVGEKIKRMDIVTFREDGYLQEANRQFFHPLGLALEAIKVRTGTLKLIWESPDGDTKIMREGKWLLGGIWDGRDDPEGWLYDLLHLDSKNLKLFRERHKKFSQIKKKAKEKRMSKLSFNIEPFPEKVTATN